MHTKFHFLVILAVPTLLKTLLQEPKPSSTVQVWNSTESFTRYQHPRRSTECETFAIIEYLRRNLFSMYTRFTFRVEVSSRSVAQLLMNIIVAGYKCNQRFVEAEKKPRKEQKLLSRWAFEAEGGKDVTTGRGGGGGRWAWARETVLRSNIERGNNIRLQDNRITPASLQVSCSSPAVYPSWHAARRDDEY